MKGKVIQFRRGRHNVHERHFLIQVDGMKNRKEASNLINAIIEFNQRKELSEKK